MRFPRRAPREVYRLYEEEEYLAGAAWEVDVASSTEPVVPMELRLRRTLSAAIVLGTMGAVAALVVLNNLPQPEGSGRRAGSPRPRPREVAEAPRITSVRRASAPTIRARPATATRRRINASLARQDTGAGTHRRERRAATQVAVREMARPEEAPNGPRSNAGGLPMRASARSAEFGFEH